MVLRDGTFAIEGRDDRHRESLGQRGYLAPGLRRGYAASDQHYRSPRLPEQLHRGADLRIVEAAAIQAEAHFKSRDLGDTWACVAVFAPDASTEGDFKADLFERFDASYRRFSRLMDRYLPDPGAAAYVDRLARLTAIRAYVRAQFLREDADLDWTDIGAKVKGLIDARIDAEVRPLMQPLSILDQDFEQKIAHLPHDEARASLMEHAVRAQINERLAANPAFFEKLSEQLERIIEELRQRLIDAAEACRRMAELRRQIQGESDIAAEHGLSPVSFAVYELLAGPGAGGSSSDSESPTAGNYVRESAGAYRIAPDDELTAVARRVERVIRHHSVVIDWSSNLEVQREMRRDIKRELRGTGDLTEERLDELAHQIVEVARRRSGP